MKNLKDLDINLFMRLKSTHKESYILIDGVSATINVILYF